MLTNMHISFPSLLHIYLSTFFSGKIIFPFKKSINKLTFFIYRYNKFLDEVSSSKSGLTPEKLPPTERSARFHSLRVHLQIVIWQTLDTAMLEPKDWGWKENRTTLSPILTDDIVAPEKLLKYIRCKCKLSSKKPCGGNTCSCRKNGLSCVAACGDCRGENCLNTNKVYELAIFKT